MTIRTLIAAAALLAAGATQAAVGNGDFSAGLAGWTTTGNVALDATASFGTPAAPFAAQAVLGTAQTGGFLFGGAVVGAAALESAAGLAAGTLSGLGGTLGSLLSTSFTAAAGDTLGFHWKFMSNEPQGGTANDLAFLAIDGVLTTLTRVNSATFTGGSASPMFDETAYAAFKSGPLAAGAHTLAFGVIDTPDNLGASALAVSGVSVTAVPEPGTAALLLAGAGVVGTLARRRRVA